PSPRSPSPAPPAHSTRAPTNGATETPSSCAVAHGANSPRTSPNPSPAEPPSSSSADSSSAATRTRKASSGPSTRSRPRTSPPASPAPSHAPRRPPATTAATANSRPSATATASRADTASSRPHGASRPPKATPGPTTAAPNPPSNPHATATGRRAGRARDSTTPRQENHLAYRRCVRAAHPAPTEAVRAARPRRRVAGAPRPLVPDRPTPQQRQPSAGRLRGPAGRRRVVRARPRLRGADGHSVRRTPHVRPLRRPPAVTHRSTTPRQEQPR